MYKICDILQVRAIQNVEGQSNDFPVWARGTSDGSLTTRDRHACDHPHGLFLERINRWGFRPDGILDVGANRGVWACNTAMVFKESDPKMFLFEASTSQIPYLTELPYNYIISVIGSRNDSIDFYHSKYAHTGNSIFKENTDSFSDIAPMKVNMHTLDDLFHSFKEYKSIPHILKIDVQGAELEVLKGASKILETIQLLILETSIANYNKGAPLMAEVVSFVHGLGFEVLDIIEMSRHRGLGIKRAPLIQCDLAFVRNGSSLLNRVHEIATVGDKSRQ